MKICIFPKTKKKKKIEKHIEFSHNFTIVFNKFHLSSTTYYNFYLFNIYLGKKIELKNVLVEYFVSTYITYLKCVKESLDIFNGYDIIRKKNCFSQYLPEHIFSGRRYYLSQRSQILQRLQRLPGNEQHTIRILNMFHNAGQNSTIPTL
jgi:hypothetical protein